MGRKWKGGKERGVARAFRESQESIMRGGKIRSPYKFLRIPPACKYINSPGNNIDFATQCKSVGGQFGEFCMRDAMRVLCSLFLL